MQLAPPKALFALFLFIVACTKPTQSTTKHQTIPASAPVISSPLVVDLDKDGSVEIVYGSWDGYLRVLSSKGEMRKGWPFFSEKGFFSSPAAADLDGDGRLEIIEGADLGLVYAFSEDGKVLPGWPRKIGDVVWSSPTIVPGKDNTSLIAIASDHFCYLLRPDGTDAPGWPQRIENWADATAAYADGVLVLTSLTRWGETGGTLYAWTLDGKPLPNFPIQTKMDIDSSPTLVDLNQDGSLEVIFGDDEGLLHAVGLSDAKEISGWPVATQGTVEASAAIADLNLDGQLEVVMGSWDSRLYVVNARGEALKGFPFVAKDQFIAQAALADLDGDRKSEIIVPSKDGFLYGLRSDGTAAPGFPIPLGAPSFSSPWVGDLDKDFFLDIVVGAANGLHIIRSVAPLGETPWPMFRRDVAHHGRF